MAKDWLCSQPGCGLYHSEHERERKVANHPYSVWKYQLSFDYPNEFMMPEGAEILSVQVQPQGEHEGQPMMWARVQTAQHQVKRRFEIVGTGHPVSGNWKYVGTFQLSDGAFVGHVFEIL